MPPREIDWELELTPELGRNNLEAMLTIQQREDIESLETTYWLARYEELLTGRSGKDLQRLSDGRDAFELCIECSYSEPYGKMGSRRCTIMKQLDYVSSIDRGFEWDFSFNSIRKSDESCFLVDLDSDHIGDIMGVIVSKNQRISEESRERYYLLRKLESLVSQPTEDRPYLPQLRPDDHFKVGDRVVEFNFDRFMGTPRRSDDIFIHCTVEKVSEVGDTYAVHTGNYASEYVWPGSQPGSSIYLWNPTLLLESEFNYLVANPEFMGLWLDFTKPIIHDEEDKFYATPFMFFQTSLIMETGLTWGEAKKRSKIPKGSGLGGDSDGE